MNGNTALTVATIDAVAQIGATDWDGCANPDPARFDPFVSHGFLAALEASGSATARTGWTPMHLVARSGDRVTGVVPAYLKSHSYGEYVFDHGWADAFERAGGRYYPKLQVAVPFTPAPGRRFLTAPGCDGAAIEAGLRTALGEIARRHGISSVHVTFLTSEEAHRAAAAGWLVRMDQQFHWRNAGYRDFADFLSALSSQKRKALRREREKARTHGLDFVMLTGSDLTERVWDEFFACYLETGARKWGRPYLTRAFFSLVSETMRGRIALAAARRNGRVVAGALNFAGSEALYGRNWGCTEDLPFLHFELCYYMAIDFAIERGLARVEAGAQGLHKLARGYAPVPTWSVHWIAHPGLRDAVARFLEQERAAVDEDIATLERHTPFRKEG